MFGFFLSIERIILRESLLWYFHDHLRHNYIFWLGSACLGSARLGSARHDSARFDFIGLNLARHDSARVGSAWLGWAHNSVVNVYFWLLYRYNRIADLPPRMWSHLFVSGTLVTIFELLVPCIDQVRWCSSIFFLSLHLHHIRIFQSLAPRKK